jgi:hypothetical protein
VNPTVSVGDIPHDDDGGPGLTLDRRLGPAELATLRRVLTAAGDPTGNHAYQVDFTGEGLATVHMYEQDATGKHYTHDGDVVTTTVKVHI